MGTCSSPHSKTLAGSLAWHSVREVLDCGCPLPLCFAATRVTQVENAAVANSRGGEGRMGELRALVWSWGRGRRGRGRGCNRTLDARVGCCVFGVGADWMVG